jgi:hypothetical protein
MARQSDIQKELKRCCREEEKCREDQKKMEKVRDISYP